MTQCSTKYQSTHSISDQMQDTEFIESLVKKFIQQAIAVKLAEPQSTINSSILFKQADSNSTITCLQSDAHDTPIMNSLIIEIKTNQSVNTCDESVNPVSASMIDPNFLILETVDTATHQAIIKITQTVTSDQSPINIPQDNDYDQEFGEFEDFQDTIILPIPISLNQSLNNQQLLSNQIIVTTSSY